MVKGIPRPSKKSATKAKYILVKKSVFKIFNFIRKENTVTNMRIQYLQFLPITLAYI